MGLLCLRVGAGIALIHYGISGLSGEALGGAITVATDVIGAVTGILLMAGLWTPIAGVVVAVMELWLAFLTKSDPSIHLLLAVLGAGLAMLGPGAWSVDSRLFGRKRLDIRDRARGGSSTPLK
jgi:putative oxidoreductase